MSQETKGGWRKQKGGDREFFKFQTPGDELIGRWRGDKQGKYGQNGIVQTKEGETYEFTLNAALMDLTVLEEGTPVRIVYTGKQVGQKSGREFKAFDVFTWDPEAKEDDPVSEFSGPDGEFEASDEDVPF